MRRTSSLGAWWHVLLTLFSAGARSVRSPTGAAIRAWQKRASMWVRAIEDKASASKGQNPQFRRGRSPTLPSAPEKFPTVLRNLG